MKILKRLICITLLIACLSCLLISVANATGSFANPSDFDNASSAASGINSVVDEAAITVISVARIVGVTIAIVMLLVIAMKYMMSSAGERADIKKHAVAYVVGAVILFGVVGILGIIENFTTTALSS